MRLTIKSLFLQRPLPLPAHALPATCRGFRVGQRKSPPTFRIDYANKEPQISKAYGDIAYAKSWCGFKHPRGPTAAYTTWREQVRAYILARSLDPAHLNDSHVKTIVLFARSLPPIHERAALIKNKHRAEDLDELNHHLRVLVRDTAKKLQTSLDRQTAERLGGGEVAGPPSKCSSRSLFRQTLTN